MKVPHRTPLSSPDACASSTPGPVAGVPYQGKAREQQSITVLELQCLTHIYIMSIYFLLRFITMSAYRARRSRLQMQCLISVIYMRSAQSYALNSRSSIQRTELVHPPYHLRNMRTTVLVHRTGRAAGGRIGSSVSIWHRAANLRELRRQELWLRRGESCTMKE